MNQGKLDRSGKDSNSTRQPKGNGDGKPQDELRFPTAVDQGFVYYEE